MKNNKTKNSPLKGWWAALPVIAKVGIIGGGLLAAKGISDARKADRRLKGQLSDAQARFDERLKEYEDLKFKPIDAEALQQENIFEDLDVNMDAFNAASREFKQSQANILQGLRGVAGASGAAGLATALSNQATQAAEQLRLNISQQLNRNKELALQEESRLNDQMRQIELANQEGARQFEIDQLSTLLGVEGQRIAGIRGAQANRQSMYGQIAGGIGNAVGSYFGSLN